MLCFLCLSETKSYQPIPCGHPVCFPCFKQRDTQKQYRCDVCLKSYEKDQLKQIEYNGDGHVEQRKRQIKRREQAQLYCFDCKIFFSAKELRISRHQVHQFQTMDTWLPLLKQQALQYLQKGQTIEVFLAEELQRLEQNPIFYRFTKIKQDIDQFFNAQIQIIEQRRKIVLAELQNKKSEQTLILDERKQRINDILVRIQEENSILDKFLSQREPVQYVKLPNLFLSIDECLTESLKTCKNTIPTILKFITVNNISSSIQMCCYLIDQDSTLFSKQQKWSLQQTIPIEKPVKLLSKLTKRFFPL